MRLNDYRKIVSLEALAELGDAYRRQGKSIVHCHGCFDIVHPGHVRYLRYAGQHADILVVSLTGDDAIEKGDGARPYIPQELRAENLAAFEFVDHVVIAEDPTAEPVIRALRPTLYVKGKEYEGSSHPGFVREKKLVEQFGGRVMFSSGDVVFSSSSIVENLVARDDGGIDEACRLEATCSRWGVTHASLHATLAAFAGKRVAVVGDSISDRYVFCDPADVANEAPILSVRPVEEKAYLGGAAIVAAHLKAMGAQPHLLTAVADDDASRELLDSLTNMGIDHTALAVRHALPRKERYLVETQKLLKVDRGDAQPLDSATERRLLGTLAELRTALDGAVFVDFGYGTVTSPLLAEAGPLLRPHVSTMAGDISGTRRTLLAMRDFDLLTPTERELRAVAGNMDGSLPTVASGIMQSLSVPRMIVTMGRKGCVMFHPRSSRREAWFASRLRSDHIPSLASHVCDVVGAGDALLAAATLSMAVGSSLQVAGYIGSAASALAINRVGNLPVSGQDLRGWMRTRSELRHAMPPVVAVG
jgi:rfaE bifunctional protein kinase chain/domain/rfaE bifunctional protein nucleotidyltransferase chain/domain